MIDVTINDNQKSEKPFPKLMTIKARGGVFLFFSREKVFCIDKGEALNWKNNEFYNGILDISAFTDYNEPVTIQNK